MNVPNEAESEGQITPRRLPTDMLRTMLRQRGGKQILLKTREREKFGGDYSRRKVGTLAGTREKQLSQESGPAKAVASCMYKRNARSSAMLFAALLAWTYRANAKKTNIKEEHCTGRGGVDEKDDGDGDDDDDDDDEKDDWEVKTGKRPTRIGVIGA